MVADFGRRKGAPPIGNAGIDQLKRYDAAYIGSTSEKVLYLTFDAGYENGCTEKILDTLQKHNVKAAFFLVGNYIEKNADLVRRMAEEGHTVGNHTMHHLQGLHCNWRVYARDVFEADRLIGSDLFRPPHGLLKPHQMRVMNTHFNIIMYDVITRDYARKLTADDVFENVRRFTRPGSIIVFHDSLKSQERMLPALPRAIEWLLRHGYSLEALPENHR